MTTSTLTAPPSDDFRQLGAIWKREADAREALGAALRPVLGHDQGLAKEAAWDGAEGDHLGDGANPKRTKALVETVAGDRLVNAAPVWRPAPKTGAPEIPLK